MSASVLFFLLLFWNGPETVCEERVQDEITMACGFTVNAGPDIVICKGESGMLNGSIVGPYDEFEWMPSTGLSSAFDLNPTVTVTVPTFYKLVARGIGSDLVQNGGFESATIAPATTAFNYVVPNDFAAAGGGSYTIGSNATFGNIWGCSAYGGNNALAWNGRGASGRLLWSQTVNVTPNTDYKFECFIMGITIPFITTPASISIEVNGSVITSAGASASSCAWNAVNATWNSGGSGTATISINNNNGGTNWGAIDDISFTECCVVEDEVFVDVIDIRALAAQAGPITCDNPFLVLDGNGSSVGAGYSYQWTTTDGMILTGGNTLMPTISKPGTYTLLVLGPGGCEEEVTITIEGSVTPPDIRVFAEILTCDKPNARITAVSTVPGTDFSWMGPNGFVGFDASFIVDEGGWYYVVVEDQYKCKAIDSIQVLDNRALPELEIEGDTLGCGQDSILLEAISTSWNLSYDWIGPNGMTFMDSLWMVGDSGTYILTVIDSNDCERMDTFVLIKDEALPGVRAEGDTITCENPIAVLRGFSDSTNVVYEWKGPNGFTGSGNMVNATDSGTYILTVTIPGGCSATDTVVITKEDDVPTIAIVGDTINCIDTIANLFGSTTTMNAMSSWVGPNGFSSNNGNISVMDSGRYTFTVIGENGCEIALEFLVIIDQETPDLNLVRDTLTCSRDSILLQVNGITSGLGLNWTGPGAFNSAMTNPKIGQAGTYILEALGANGCASLDSVIIEEDKDEPTITLMTDTINCIKSFADVISNSLDNITNYNWSGPNGFSATTKDIQPTDGGRYVLSVTSENGCMTDIFVDIVVDTVAPAFSLSGDTLDCSTPALNIGVNGSNGSYQWTGPNGFSSMMREPEVRDSGWYELTITGLNGCSEIQRIYINQTESTPQLDAIGDTITCLKDSAIIIGSTMETGVTYSWVGPNGFTSTQLINTVRDSGWYTFTVRTPADCFSEISVYVGADLDGPEITSLIVEGLKCDSNRTTIYLEEDGSTVSFQWTGPAGFTSMDQNPIISNIGWYRILLTGANGCTTLDSIYLVSQDVRPDASAFSDTLNCLITEVTLTGFSLTPDVSYEWRDPSGGLISSDSITKTTMTGIYQFIVRDDNGCTGFTEIEVTSDYTRANGDVTTEEFRCDNAPGKFLTTVTPIDASISWTGPGSFMGSGTTVDVTESGQYQLITIHPETGCPDTSYHTMSMSSDTIENAQIDVTNIGCNIKEGSIEVLSVTGSEGPYEYILDLGPTQSSGLFNGVNSGIHNLEIIDRFGCSYFTSVQIDSSGGGSIQLPADITIKKGGNALLTLTTSFDPMDIASISWDPSASLSCSDCSDPTATPSTTTTYLVTVTDIKGCTYTEEITVFVDSNTNFYIPNSFSPNGDGLNDKIYIHGNPDAKIKSLRIFNRWGEVVFQVLNGQVDDPTFGWDGNFRGELVPPGVFVYYAEIILDTEVVVKSGDVTIIR